MGSLLIIGYYSQWLKLVELFTMWSPFYPILLDGLVLHLRLETQTHTFRPICVFGQLASYVRLPQLVSYCISIATGTLKTVKSEFHI